MFVRELNRRLALSAIIVDAVNPGYCYSELRRGFTGLKAVFDWLMEKTLALTAEQGSRQIVFAAIGGGEYADHLRGAYISRSDVVDPSDFVLSKEGEEAQHKIWVRIFCQ